MMRDAEQTIGNLIDKQKTAFIASVDGDGFPQTLHLCVWLNIAKTLKPVSISWIDGFFAE